MQLSYDAINLSHIYILSLGIEDDIGMESWAPLFLILQASNSIINAQLSNLLYIYMRVPQVKASR